MKYEQLENAKNLFFVALFIDIAITAIVGFNSFLTINTLEEIQSGIQGTDSALLKSIELWANISKLTLITMIGVGIALVKWLNTCYRYAKKSIGASGFKNEKWTTAGWVIPFISLFKPYQIINEIYKAGAVGYSANDDWKKQNGSGLLLTWWTFYAITHFIMWISSRQILRRFNMEDDLTFSQIIGLYDAHVWVCGISVVIALLWFLVANHLTQRLLDRTPLISQSTRPSGLGARNHVSVTPKTVMTNYDDTYSLVSSSTTTRAKTRSPISVPVGSTVSEELTSGSLGLRTEQPKTSNLSATSPSQGKTVVQEVLSMDEMEDAIYERIGTELESNTLDKGAWTRAFALEGGDDAKTRATYIQIRFEKLKKAEVSRFDGITSSRERAVHPELEHEQKCQQERERAQAQDLFREVSIPVATETDGVPSASEAIRFHNYVRYGKIEEVIGMLKSNPGLISVCNDKGDTALYIAAIENNVGLAKLLIASGAKLDERYSLGTNVRKFFQDNEMVLGS